MGTAADILYGAVRILFLVFFRLCFRWRVEGAEHIPRHGACIIFANHRSWYDIPVLGCAVPRKLRFMAKKELFAYPVFGAVLRLLGGFPVNRGNPDRAAIRQALDILGRGEAIGIFPEGTRSRTGQLQPAQPGVAYLAHKSGAPVVPVAIISSYRWFGPITVRVGRPLYVDGMCGDRARSNELTAVSQRLMQEVGALLQPPNQPSPVASSSR